MLRQNLQDFLSGLLKQVSDTAIKRFFDHWILYTLLGISTASFMRRVTKNRGLPPGPWGVPILGALFRVSEHAHVDFMKMIPRYGEVMSLYFGNELVIVLNSSEAIKEAFLKQNLIFAGRPKDLLFDDIGVHEPIFHVTYSEQWAKTKKDLLTALRSIGYGQASQEGLVQEEADYLVRLIKEGQSDKRKLVFEPFVLNAMSNVTLRILFNKRHEADDEEGKSFIESVETFNEELISALGSVYLPFGRYLFYGTISRLKSSVVAMDTYLQKRIAEHRESFDPKVIRDFTDMYFKDKGKSGMTEDEMKNLCGSLIPDAVGTVATLFNWVLMDVASHPEVQVKVHEELDKVTGRSRPPNLHDKPDLPYTEAVIAESMRYSSFFQLGPPRATMQETTLYGYRIPKGCHVWPNFFAAHRDPKIWKNPNAFDPCHFLDENGQFNKKKPLFNFSIGRRSCLGEPLSKLEIFLFFITIMNNFRIKHDDNQMKLPTPEDEPDFCRLKNTQLIFENRS